MTLMFRICVAAIACFIVSCGPVAMGNDLTGPCFTWGSPKTCEASGFVAEDACDGCSAVTVPVPPNGFYTYYQCADKDGIDHNEGKWSVVYVPVESVTSGQNLGNSNQHICYWDLTCDNNCSVTPLPGGGYEIKCSVIMTAPRGWWQYDLTGQCQ